MVYWLARNGLSIISSQLDKVYAFDLRIRVGLLRSTKAYYQINPRLISRTTTPDVTTLFLGASDQQLVPQFVALAHQNVMFLRIFCDVKNS